MKTCNCSKPATVRKCGDWMCETCAKDFSSPHFSGVKQIQSRGGTMGMRRMWDSFDMLPIAGASLLILDSWLKGKHL